MEHDPDDPPPQYTALDWYWHHFNRRAEEAAAYARSLGIMETAIAYARMLGLK